MRRTYGISLLATALAVVMSGTALAQNVSFARPGFRWGWGGYGYGYHSSTALEGALRGRAAALEAAGEYNLSNSMAAINYEQAYRMSLENSVQRAETFFTARRINESYHASKRGAPPSAEQLSQRSKQLLPDRLTVDQYEPAFGTLFWPAAFDGAKFAQSREAVDQLMADRAAQAGVGSQHYRDVVRLAGEMRDELRTMIDDMTPEEYMHARSFLDSVAYEARYAPDVEGLAAR